jgi:hypothetical protein
MRRGKLALRLLGTECTSNRVVWLHPPMASTYVEVVTVTEFGPWKLKLFAVLSTWCNVGVAGAVLSSA